LGLVQGFGGRVPPHQAQKDGLHHVLGVRRVAGDPVGRAEDQAVVLLEEPLDFGRTVFRVPL